MNQLKPSATMIVCDHALYYPDELFDSMSRKLDDEVCPLLRGIDVTEVVDCKGLTLLHLAAMCGNTLIATSLIQAGCAVDALDDCGCTPLLFAVRMDSAGVAKMLIDAEADVTRVNRKGRSILGSAAERGDPAVIHALTIALRELDYDAESLAALMMDHDYPLQYAVRLGESTATRLMIAKGANVNRQDLQGKTALHTAVLRGDHEHVIALLENGADANLKDANGGAPLRTMALANQHPDTVRALLFSGARIHELDASGRMQCQQIFRYGNAENVGLLLRYGVDLTKADEHGDTVVHYSAVNQDVAVLRLMFDKDFDVDVRNLSGVTPLHYAVGSGNVICARMLLERGADPNYTEVDGRSPLFFAIQLNDRFWLERRKSMIRTLFEFGADMSQPTPLGSAVPLAIGHGVRRITETLVQQLAKLEIQGANVSEDDVRAVDDDRILKAYRETCERELLAMKEHRFDSCKMMYFGILTDRMSVIADATRKSGVVDEFNATNLGELYPEYKSALLDRFNRGLERRRMIDNAAETENNNAANCVGF